VAATPLDRTRSNPRYPRNPRHPRSIRCRSGFAVSGFAVSGFAVSGFAVLVLPFWGLPFWFDRSRLVVLGSSFLVVSSSQATPS
jgi:hypothetical protein